MNKVSYHIKHYTPLFGILVATLLGFWIFKYDRFFQIALTLAAAIGYVTWGLIHHALHKDLTWSIVVEYIAIAILGIVVVFSVVIRA